MNNKPRTYRIQFLEHIDDEGLLEDTDWSLGFSFKGIYNWGDKRRLPKKFLEKYKDVLPKAYEDDINEVDFNQGFLAKRTKLQEHGAHGGQLRMIEKESYLDPFFTYHGLLGKSKYALVVETIGYHLLDENWSDEKLEQFMQEPIDNDFPIWNFYLPSNDGVSRGWRLCRLDTLRDLEPAFDAQTACLCQCELHGARGWRCGASGMFSLNEATP